MHMSSVVSDHVNLNFDIWNCWIDIKYSNTWWILLIDMHITIGFAL